MVVSVFELSQDVSGEVILYLAMAGDRLTCAGSGILIPIMTTAVPNKNASVLFDLTDQVNALHAS